MIIFVNCSPSWFTKLDWLLLEEFIHEFPVQCVKGIIDKSGYTVCWPVCILVNWLETDRDTCLTPSLCRIHYTLVGFLLSCFTVLFRWGHQSESAGRCYQPLSAVTFTGWKQHRLLCPAISSEPLKSPPSADIIIQLLLLRCCQLSSMLWNWQENEILHEYLLLFSPKAEVTMKK